MPSQAWADFLDDLREATELLRADPSSHYAGRAAATVGLQLDVNVSLSSALTKACVMLTSGRLQGCIESQVEEFLERIDQSGVVVDQIPEALRGALSAHYFRGRTSLSVAQTATVHKAYVPLWSTGQPLPAGTLRTDTLPDKVWNPRPDRVQALLTRCDVDLYGWITNHFGAPYLADMKQYVDDLIEFRNKVAHGTEPPAWTRADVRLRMQWATRLARAVDGALDQKLALIVGAGW